MARFLFLFMILGAATALAAQTSAQSYVWQADFTYSGRYVFRGRQMASESFQPSIQATHNSAYGSLWLNQPFRRAVGRELDLNAGYRFALNSAWSLDAGSTFYDYAGAGESPTKREHSFEGYLGLSGSLGGIDLGLYAFRDLTLDTTTVQGSSGYSLPWNDWATLHLTATVGVAAPDRGDDYVYGTLGANLIARISDTKTFSFGLNGSSTHHLTGGDKSRLWFTAGFNASF